MAKIIQSPDAIPNSLAITTVMECLLGAQQLLIEGWYDDDNHMNRQFTLEDALDTALFQVSHWHPTHGTEHVERITGALVKAMQRYIEREEAHKAKAVAR